MAVDTCFAINATLLHERGGKGKVIIVHCPNGVLRTPLLDHRRRQGERGIDLSSGVYCIEV